MNDTSTLIELEPEEVAELLAAGEIVLIDVRESYEFDAARIEGAELFPLSTFDPAALPQTDKPVVFQCASGVRSINAVEACLAAGVQHNRHMRGGIRAWHAVGLPIVS